MTNDKDNNFIALCVYENKAYLNIDCASFDTACSRKLPTDFVNYPQSCTQQLDMISKPTNAHKCMKVYYIQHILPTCFGHSCGHL